MIMHRAMSLRSAASTTTGRLMLVVAGMSYEWCMPIRWFIGVDLAWGEGTEAVSANETGVVAVDDAGTVVRAGWTRGVAETVEWIESTAGEDSALAFVDAPLVVNNPTGQRQCERQVGQRYGRWKVSANSTNLSSRGLAGVALVQQLEQRGWQYDDGHAGPRAHGRTVCECYPYTTLVGVEELGYHVERPRYKRRPRRVPVESWRRERATACDDLTDRLVQLRDADPPLTLDSHSTTAQLVKLPSPLDDRSYKHREDLIDAVLCAWTGLFWHRHGLSRCQVLGLPESTRSPAATIIAPARLDQRPRDGLDVAVRAGHGGVVRPTVVR
jgi:predicted RNase H-like nuclease